MIKDEDPKEIESRLTQFTIDSSLLDQMFPQLLPYYPEQWAAVYKGELALARTQCDLIAKLGERAPYAAMRQLVPDRTLILH